MDEFGDELGEWLGGEVNVGERERIASVLGGCALLAAAIAKRGFAGAVLGVIGAGLVYRGASGYCPLCKKLNEDGA